MRPQELLDKICFILSPEISIGDVENSTCLGRGKPKRIGEMAVACYEKILPFRHKIKNRFVSHSPRRMLSDRKDIITEKTEAISNP